MASLVYLHKGKHQEVCKEEDEDRGTCEDEEACDGTSFEEGTCIVDNKEEGDSNFDCVFVQSYFAPFLTVFDSKTVLDSILISNFLHFFLKFS